MRVVSACPLPVASWLWQSHSSAWVLTVVCRATFALQPGESSLAEDQEAPIEDDDHWDDDPGRSLRVASDLAPLKPLADVTLVGHAFAPRGAAARSVVARLVVGEIDKSIEVCVDRFFDAEGALSEGAPFKKLPLLYERAAGGKGTSNPVGLDGSPDAYGCISLPNLQPPGTVISSPKDLLLAPIGFGPIAPGWPSRRDRLGRYAALAAPDGQRQPLPEDLDAGYFNHAPRDQQLAELRDDERLILENLHPEHPRLVTNLPGLRPRATVQRRGGKQTLAMRCDTLWIDTDRALAALTWRAQVPLEKPEEDGWVMIALDTPGRARTRAASQGAPSSPASVPAAPPIRRDLHDLEDAGETLVPGMYGGSAEINVLPFASAAASANVPRPRASEPGVGLPFIGAAPAPMPPPIRPADPPTAPGPLPASVQTTLPPGAARPNLQPSWMGASTETLPPPGPAPPPVAPPLVNPVAPSANPIAPPVKASPWSTPEAPAGAVPMTLGQLAVESAGLPEPAPPPPPGTTAEAARASAPSITQETKSSKIEVKKAIHLVWYDSDCLPRVRRARAFAPILAAIEERPIDVDFDDPALAKDPTVVEDRRDVFEVLARGEAADEPKLAEAVDAALRDDGRFVPPFLLIAGELRVPFDELATLKANVAIASPFAAGDEPLRAAVADARDFLSNPEPMCPPSMIEGYSLRIQEAFRKMRRAAVPPSYLEEQVERALVERRSYQRREIFGSTHVRLLLMVGQTVGSSAPKPWPLYLPEYAAKRLPLFARIEAKLLGEIGLQEDQFESHPFAIRATALARLAPMPGRTPSKA